MFVSMGMEIVSMLVLVLAKKEDKDDKALLLLLLMLLLLLLLLMLFMVVLVSGVSEIRRGCGGELIGLRFEEFVPV